MPRKVLALCALVIIIAVPSASIQGQDGKARRQRRETPASGRPHQRPAHQDEHCDRHARVLIEHGPGRCVRSDQPGQGQADGEQRPPQAARPLRIRSSGQAHRRMGFNKAERPLRGAFARRRKTLTCSLPDGTCCRSCPHIASQPGCWPRSASGSA